MGIQTGYEGDCRDFGIARRLCDRLIEACERQGESIDVVRYLSEDVDSNALDEIARHGIAGWKAGRMRDEVEWVERMTYAPLPSFADLEAAFGKGHVSERVCYSHLTHASREGMIETPGVKTFCLMWCGIVDATEAIAKLGKLGYLPATHLEAYHVVMANPERHHRFRIIALGTSVRDGDHRRVMVLGSDSKGTRYINYVRVGGGSMPIGLFLGIRA